MCPVDDTAKYQLRVGNARWIEPARTFTYAAYEELRHEGQASAVFDSHPHYVAHHQSGAGFQAIYATQNGSTWMQLCPLLERANFGIDVKAVDQDLRQASDSPKPLGATGRGSNALGSFPRAGDMHCGTGCFFVAYLPWLKYSCLPARKPPKRAVSSPAPGPGNLDTGIWHDESQ